MLLKLVFIFVTGYFQNFIIVVGKYSHDTNLSKKNFCKKLNSIGSSQIKQEDLKFL